MAQTVDDVEDGFNLLAATLAYNGMPLTDAFHQIDEDQESFNPMNPRLLIPDACPLHFKHSTAQILNPRHSQTPAPSPQGHTDLNPEP